jgi:hypothetical protein
VLAGAVVVDLAGAASAAQQLDGGLGVDRKVGAAPKRTLRESGRREDGPCRLDVAGFAVVGGAGDGYALSTQTQGRRGAGFHEGGRLEGLARAPKRAPDLGVSQPADRFSVAVDQHQVAPDPSLDDRSAADLRQKGGLLGRSAGQVADPP